MLYVSGRFERGRALVCDDEGRGAAVLRLESPVVSDEDLRRDLAAAVNLDASHIRVLRLPGRAMLPGMANAHSHAFQRVIRGRTEYRSAGSEDSFWTWREMMYAASERLSPEDIYDASRMAFLEMALSGITSVGEFHYLHRTARGEEYDDANLLSKQVVRAARDVGIRIALLRVAYARAGFRKAPDERQRRFIEPDAETFTRNTESLLRDLARDEATGDATPTAWVGVAPHSVRAVPLEYLREVRDFADARALALHMHVAEQPAEVAACVEETGRTPVALLSDEGVLGERFTGVHAVHITPEELRLGTDSHAQIDLLEDARELEYHLRLLRLRRNVLAPAHDESRGGEARRPAQDEAGKSGMSALAARLFECATGAGVRSIGLDAGDPVPGRAADFFIVDLSDPSIVGASEEDLLPAIVFSLSRTAVRDVCVGGRLIVEDGKHAAQEEIVTRFAALQRRLWK